MIDNQQRLREIQSERVLVLEEMIRRKEREAQERSTKGKYRKDFLLWAEERFGENPANFDWTRYGLYDDHQWDGTPNPFHTAIKAIENNKWAAIGSCTTSGKTYLAPRLAYWFLDCWPDSYVVCVSGGGGTNLETQLWAEMQKAFPKFKALYPHATIKNFIIRKDGRKEPKEGKQEKPKDMIVGKTPKVSAGKSSNESAQGDHAEHMLIILDEATGLDRQLWKGYIHTCMSDHNLILALYNPVSTSDSAYNFRTQFAHRVTGVNISALDHPNVVSGRPLIPGTVTKKSVGDMQEAYDEDDFFYLTRIRGLHPESARDSVVDAAAVMRCVVGHPTYIEAGEIEKKGWKPGVGVDVAWSDSGDPACCVYGNGNEVTDLFEFKCPSKGGAGDLGYNLLYDDFEMDMYEVKHRYNIPTLRSRGIAPDGLVVDSNAGGEATAYTLYNNKGNLKINNFHHFIGGADPELTPNRRVWVNPDGVQPGYWKDEPMIKYSSIYAQMYHLASEVINKRQVRINLPLEVATELSRELGMRTREYVEGVYKIEKKDQLLKTLGHSPNKADAFVMWLYQYLKNNRFEDLKDPMWIT